MKEEGGTLANATRQPYKIKTGKQKQKQEKKTQQQRVFKKRIQHM